MAPVAFAQTPDGATPANEGVCDVLQVDGVTKGLYGLCVAFCEAQDFASVSGPMTEEDLEKIMDVPNSGNILANYNKKKERANNVNDPDMPCIKVEEPCPCWAADELATIDGIMYDGYVATRTWCDDRDDDFGSFQRSSTILYEWDCPTGVCRISSARTGRTNERGYDQGFCAWEDVETNPYSRIVRSVSFGKFRDQLTIEQYEFCRNDIRNQIETIRSSCNFGNQQ